MLRKSLRKINGHFRRAHLVICNSDFAQRHQRLVAELGYAPQYKRNFGTLMNEEDYESGLVQGARVVRGGKVIYYIQGSI